MKSETIRGNSTTARNRTSSKTNDEQPGQMQAGAADVAAPTKLIVSFNRETFVIPVDSILYIESVKRKVFIHTDGSVFQTYSTMKDMIARLPGDFIRCHNSFLVNPARVTKMSSAELTLASGDTITVSRRYSKDVRIQLREAGA